MRHIVLLFSIIYIGFLGSCSKFDDLEKQLDSTANLSSLAVFNAVPNSVRMDVFLDGEPMNVSNDRLAFGGYVLHKNRFSGKKIIRIVNYHREGQDTYEGSIDLLPARFYSVFVNKENKQIVIAQVEDDMIKPQPGFAKIRVAHMSYDAPPLTVSGTAAKQLFREVKYKEVTSFANVASAADQTFSILPTSLANTPRLEQVLKPRDQGIYTLLIKGYVKANNETEVISTTLVEH